MKLNLLVATGLFALVTNGMPFSVRSFDGFEKSTDTAYYSSSYSDEVAIEEIESNARTYHSYSETFMEGYFRALNKNMGANVQGSCGYVAAAMLLSYFDTFYNDTLIPEQYDVFSECDNTDFVQRNCSPGVLYDISREDFSKFEYTYDYSKSLHDNANALSFNQYFKIIQSKTDISLHAKLISIGNELGYLVKENPYASALSVSFDQFVNVINAYFEYLGYTPAWDYSFSYKAPGTGTNESAINMIKQLIDIGQPMVVFLSGSVNSGANGKHICIAYAYDDDHLYVNLGVPGLERVALDDYYNNIDAYGSLYFNPKKIPQTHSDNYVVVDSITGKRKAYCPCSCGIITYKQLPHTYGASFGFYDKTKHKSYCECGAYILENHEFFSIKTPNGSIQQWCKQCTGISTYPNSLVDKISLFNERNSKL